MIEAVEIALIARLLKRGTCIESKRNESLIRRYRNAGWIVKGSRRLEWKIAEHAREAVTARLAALLPSWEDDFNILLKAGKSLFNVSDVEALPALRRAAPRKELINRRNWNAISGAGPKSQHKRTSEDTLTNDWLLRIRPNRKLIALIENEEVDLFKFTSLFTECTIPERGWLRIRGFAGELPKCILTCENLGAFVDLPEIAGVSLVHSPGKDVGPAVQLLNMLPDSKWLHFGDIDPEGIRIAVMISKKSNRPFDIYVPSFLEDYFDLGFRKKVNWGKINLDIPFLGSLRERGIGIYQERYMLDKRLQDDISKACLRQ